MTDRELLELAAKAAGKVLIRSRIDDPMNRDFLVANSDRNDHHENGPWNPLTDDGDALRLAVKLRLIIDPVVKPMDGTYPCAAVLIPGGINYITESFGDDPYAATRRAIVRAAAAIGQSRAATSSGDSR